MAYTFVATQNFSATNAPAYTMASPNNLLIYCFLTSTGGGSPFITSAPTTPGGTSLTSAFGSINNANSLQTGPAGERIQFYYYTPGQDASAPTSATFTFNGGTPGTCLIAVFEYSGIATINPLIATVGALNTQAAPGTGTDAILSNTQTVGTVPALIFCSSVNSTGAARPSNAGTGYTLRAAINAFGSMEDKRLITSGSVTATFTDTVGTQTYNTQLLAFAEPQIASGPLPQRIWTMG